MVQLTRESSTTAEPTRVRSARLAAKAEGKARKEQEEREKEEHEKQKQMTSKPAKKTKRKAEEEIVTTATGEEGTLDEATAKIPVKKKARRETERNTVQSSVQQEAVASVETKRGRGRPRLVREAPTTSRNTSDMAQQTGSQYQVSAEEKNAVLRDAREPIEGKGATKRVGNDESTRASVHHNFKYMPPPEQQVPFVTDNSPYHYYMSEFVSE